MVATCFENITALQGEKVPLKAHVTSNSVVVGKYPNPNLLEKGTEEAKRFLTGIDDDAGMILVVRDPRDVYLSEHGKEPGQPFTRNLKFWINFAKHAISVEDHPRVLLVKYEDLVNDPDHIQNLIRDKFGLSITKPFSKFHDGLEANPLLTGHNIKELRGVRPPERGRASAWLNASPEQIAYLRDKFDARPPIYVLMNRFGYKGGLPGSETLAIVRKKFTESKNPPP